MKGYTSRSVAGPEPRESGVEVGFRRPGSFLSQVQGDASVPGVLRTSALPPSQPPRPHLTDQEAAARGQGALSQDSTGSGSLAGPIPAPAGEARTTENS